MHRNGRNPGLCPIQCAVNVRCLSVEIRAYAEAIECTIPDKSSRRYTVKGV
jgi:hypothetical protein